jgi:ABC-type transport system substrate-binding protein
MKKILFIVLSLAVLAGLVLIGCSSPSTTPTATTPTATATTPTATATTPTATATTPTATATTPTATATSGLGDLAKPPGGKEGGRLQLSIGANLADIGDPTGSAGPMDAGVSFLAVEPLLLVDQNGNLKPWLAEDFEIAPDKSSITLFLRHGVYYTDGSPFNAEAAKYNVDNGINSMMWPNMKKFSQCTIINDYTIKIDFVNGLWDWIAVKSLGTFWSAMMWCPNYLENTPTETKMTHVVGTGPFIQTGYEPNLKVTFDKNPDYWRGAPYLDGIDISVITDTNVTLMAFKSGKLHTIGVQPQDAAGLVNDGFELRESTDMVFNMCLLPSSGNPSSILSDINLRRAVESAIDKQALVDAFTYGYGHVTNQGFCLPPYMDPTTVGYPYDLTAVQNYLTLGGHPDGFTTTLYMVIGGPDDVPMAISGMLADVGITMNVEKIGYLQLVEMIGGGGTGWDGYIWMYGFPGTTVDPASTLINGPLNAVHPSPGDPSWVITTWISCEQPTELCDLAERGAQETDAAARIPIYQELSRLTTDKYCQWSYLYYVPTLSSISPVVKGHTVGQYKEFYAYTFAWLDQ